MYRRVHDVTQARVNWSESNVRAGASCECKRILESDSWWFIASYPGLLTPAFVACSTNAGEGLVKLSHVVWCTWTYGGVAHSFCTAVKRLSESKKHRQDCLILSSQSFYGLCLRSVSLTCCFFLGMCHSSTRPGTSLHVTQFYKAFSRISTASGKWWDEKAWVQRLV